jgi:hypothetical protein
VYDQTLSAYINKHHGSRVRERNCVVVQENDLLSCSIARELISEEMGCSANVGEGESV